MKIRQGFVSNSSSSSFMIAWVGDEKEGRRLTKEVFTLPKDYPIQLNHSNALANCLWNNIITTVNDFTSYQVYRLNEMGCETLDEAEVKLIMDGYTLGFGSVSDEEGGIEALLCDSDINYISPALVIKKEGGY